MRYLILLLAVTLAACEGDDRTPLLIYSPHGKEMLRTYEAAFEAERPDVDVQWIDLGSQEVYDRISGERANTQASVWWGAPQTLFMQAAEEGLLQPFEPSWADAVPETARDAQGRWWGTYLTPEGMLFNTEAVADPPTDWDQLLEPEWADRILIRSPLESGTMRTIWGALILRQPTVEDGYRWLARLDMNTKGYAANPTQLYLQIARDEADITLWNLPDTFLQAQTYPFGFRAPDSGTPVLVDAIGIPEGAPQSDLAKEFIEFVTTQDALIEQAKEFHRIPARTDVEQSFLPDWMAGGVYQPMDLDWNRLATDGPDWMQYWDERIKGRGAEYLEETDAATLEAASDLEAES
ncbi:extracellular solute-binding protein [Rubrivirga sp.]|uniref:extracellular solute-binding protein n=1 Tax=Rubrivirga sp. TaxID=1885344 RepID=UPI003C71190D